MSPSKGSLRAALRRVELPRHEQAVMGALIDLWQPAGGLYARVSTIGERAHYCERRARAALASLKEKGLVLWRRRRHLGNQTSNEYRFGPKLLDLLQVVPCATDGKDCRQQPATLAVSSRQPLPTNGDPSSEGSVSTGEGGPLVERVFREERFARYGTHDHGRMRADALASAGAALLASAGRLAAWARERGLEPPGDLPAALARGAVRAWLGDPGSRGVVAERRHAFGLLRVDWEGLLARAEGAMRAELGAKLPPPPPPPARTRPAPGDQPRMVFRVPGSPSSGAAAPSSQHPASSPPSSDNHHQEVKNVRRGRSSPGSRERSSKGETGCTPRHPQAQEKD